MSQKIQVRRGTAAQLAGLVLDAGEPGYTVDTKQWFAGDGVTAGGVFIGPVQPVDLAAINVSAAVASQNLFAAVNFPQLTAKIVAGAGSGAYVANYVLPVLAGLLPGALLLLNIELPASANPTLNIYDSSTAGTLVGGPVTNLLPATGAYWFGIFKFGATNWHPLFNNYRQA